MFLERSLIIVVLTCTSSYTVEIKTKQGKVIGTREETVFERRHYYAFYGVPYAQSPVGKLRFKDPVKPIKWKTPLDASIRYHGACAQAHVVHKHGIYGQEDCLNLNIYTPLIPRDGYNNSKPVAVWIHGYAFTSSMSHIFGSDFLIDKDIIVVTVTHRVGIFGFLRINDSSPDANMGLKDIVMALKWIRNNIKQFGGDTNKITVIGNDSGATYISLLLLTGSKRLFSNLILQSGGMFSPSLFQGNSIVERERLKSNLAKLGHNNILLAPMEDLVKASQNIYTNKEIINFQRPVVPFTPTLEIKSSASLLKITLDEIYRNVTKLNFNKSILIGYNSKESIPEAIPFIHNAHYLKMFQSYFKFMVPYTDGCAYNYTKHSYLQIANNIKHYYFKKQITEKSINNFLQYTTDLRIYPILKFIKALLASTKSKVYGYKFNYVGGYNIAKATSLGRTNIKIKGAANGDEICYVFKCEPLWENYVNLSVNHRDRIFIKQTSEMWANFIKYGDPSLKSGTVNIAWPALTLKKNKIMLLDNVPKAIDSEIDGKAFRFWEDLYEKYYANIICNRKMHDEL